MEPKYSVLLFSKYSVNCKKLFDLLQDTGIQFELLCIDNEKIRQRIKNTREIQISSVPCLLSIFPDGTIETYEGEHCFRWVESRRPAPPPVPQPVSQPVPQPVHVPIPQEYVQPPVQNRPDISDQEMAQPIQRAIPRAIQRPAKPRPKQVRFEDLEDVEDLENEEQAPETLNATPIDDIPFENDRHRTVKQPKRVRQNENQYIEDEEFYGGDEPNIRKEPSNVLKKNPQKGPARQASSDMHGTMAKAKAMQEGRNEIDDEFAPQSKRPMDARRS